MTNDHAVTRRGFARLAVVAGAVTALGVASTGVAFGADAGALSQHEKDLVLRLARAVATEPVPFPSFGEAGPPLSRVTEERLDLAYRRLSTTRRGQVQQAAALLTEADLPTTDVAQAAASIGKLASAGNAETNPALRAIVALAVSAVSTHFDPNADSTAELWLGFARHYHMRLAG
jgi:hypothetical protein